MGIAEHRRVFPMRGVSLQSRSEKGLVLKASGTPIFSALGSSELFIRHGEQAKNHLPA